MMKILRIEVDGLDLFKDTVVIDFYAKQRVNSDKNEMLTHLFSNIYLNNVVSFYGINASGKTTTLKLISFVTELLNNKRINDSEYLDVLSSSTNNSIEINTYFISSNNQLFRLRTEIAREFYYVHNKRNYDKKYYIVAEELFEKTLASVRKKSDLFDFSNASLIQKRSKNELYLLKDVSIIVAFNNQSNERLEVIDCISWTYSNEIRILDELPIELIRFLDPSIEYMKVDSKEGEQSVDIKLKFFQSKEIDISNPNKLENYLSSGTLKGINTFMKAVEMLSVGGYLIVDELENHFNKEIVSTLIRMFMSHELNKSGAVLIFSTHYVELLDLFDRNDNVYIVKNTEGIQVDCLSELIQRNDIKKSDLIQSGSIKQTTTTPSYEAYMNFKQAMRQKNTFG